MPDDAPVEPISSSILLRALATQDCERISCAGVPQNDDAELVRHFPNIPKGHEQDAIRLLDAYIDPSNAEPSAFVIDPKCRDEVFQGVYRLVSNVMDTQQRGLKGVIQTLRKGYFDDLDWSHARIIDNSGARGNSQTAASLANTQSDAPEHFLVVRFKYINPTRTKTLVNQVLANSTYTDPSIANVTHTGTWHVISAGTKHEDDGTDTIVMTLAQPQFTLAAYQNVGGADQADIYYLWNVPKDLAQTILDAWKAAHPTGSDGTASYDKDAKLVNITLRVAAMLGDTLTTEAFEIRCDTTLLQYFGWGLTTTAAETFINAKKTIATQASPQLQAGVWREVKVGARGDGLVDVIISEYYTPYVEAKHLVSMTVAQGCGDSEAIAYGYEVPITLLATVHAAYAAASPGQEKKLEIKRNAERCNFEYVGVVKTVWAKLASFATTGAAGVTVTHDNAEGATAMPTVASAKRKRVKLTGKMDNAGRYNYTLDTETVLEVTDTATTGTNGVGEKVYVGKNADAGDLAALITAQSLESAVRKRVVLDIEPHDDNTVDYKVKVNTVQETADAASSHNGGGGAVHGVTEYIWVGSNADAGDVQTLITAQSIFDAPNTKVNIQVFPNDDGSVNYVITKSVRTQNTAEITVDSGGASPFGGTKTGSYSGANVAPADLAGIVTTIAAVVGQGRAWNVDVETHEDNTVSYRMTFQERVQAEKDSEAFFDPASTDANVKLGALKATRKVYVGTAVDHDALAATIPTGQGINNDGQLRIHDDGRIDYYVESINRLPKETTVTAVTQIGALKVEVVITRKENQTAAPGANSYTEGIEERFENVSINDDDTHNYTYIKTTWAIASGYAYTFDGGPPEVATFPITLKRSKVTERRREVVFGQYFIYQAPNVYVSVWLDYDRVVELTLTAGFSVGPATLPTAATDVIYEQKELKGGIWLVTKTVVSYPAWGTGAVDKAYATVT